MTPVTGLLSTREAAAYLGISPRTLSNWRRRGKGPSPVVMGGRHFYRRRDLDALKRSWRAAS